MRLNSADKFMWIISVHDFGCKSRLVKFHVSAQCKTQAVTVLKTKDFFKEWTKGREDFNVALVKRAPALGSALMEGRVS